MDGSRFGVFGVFSGGGGSVSRARAIAGLDEPYGLAIKEELEEYYDTEIHHSRLYPNLDTLVDKGLVKKGKYDNRTNSYSLTQWGRREIDARREWEDQYTSFSG